MSDVYQVSVQLETSAWEPIPHAVLDFDGSAYKLRCDVADPDKLVEELTYAVWKTGMCGHIRSVTWQGDKDAPEAELNFAIPVKTSREGEEAGRKILPHWLLVKELNDMSDVLHVTHEEFKAMPLHKNIIAGAEFLHSLEDEALQNIGGYLLEGNDTESVFEALVESPSAAPWLSLAGVKVVTSLPEEAEEPYLVFFMPDGSSLKVGTRGVEEHALFVMQHKGDACFKSSYTGRA